MIRSLRGWLVPIAVMAVIVWSFATINLDLTHFGSGLQAGKDLVWSMFPHSRADLRYEWSLRSNLWDPFLETIQMAVVGTVVGGLVALPLSFFAARTTSLPRVFTGTLKTYLNFSRAVPTIVYALLAVSAVGLGKAAGAIAIAFVSCNLTVASATPRFWFFTRPLMMYSRRTPLKVIVVTPLNGSTLCGVKAKMLWLPGVSV